jgi:hypothetical protein
MGDAEIPQAGEAMHPDGGVAVAAMSGGEYPKDALPLVGKWCGCKPVVFDGDVANFMSWKDDIEANFGTRMATPLLTVRHEGDAVLISCERLLDSSHS